MSSVSVRKLLNPEIVVRVYILSFVFHALFGIVQQVSFYGFGYILFATQPGRMNGFTYEPSYFATYLSASLPLVIMLSLLSDKTDRHKYLYYIPAGIIISATIISTSKMFIVIWLLVGLCLIVLIASMIVFRKIKSNLKTIMFGSANVFIASLVSILLIYVTMNHIPKIFSSTTTDITITKKTEQILESKEETSFGPRIEEFMKTMRVALENPIIGTSLGGIAPHKAVKSGVDPKSNPDVKMFEGMSIYAEILAGLGIIGFLIFVAFVLKLTYDSLKTSFMLMKGDEVFKSVIVFSLLSGLFVELVTLSFNQNILRFYLWNQIAVLGLALESYRKL
ncbi:MAG: O-antigen ligase family protein [Spirochaetes bacterium]|nr:O-antigen ligase family protein [Spirochaetota bacterium]